jgi:hypothetical protein
MTGASLVPAILFTGTANCSTWSLQDAVPEAKLRGIMAPPAPAS